jgi:hypothetical protein
VVVETFTSDDDAAEVVTGFRKRRKVQRWSKEEELLLIRLVSRHGEGNWAEILAVAGDGFNRRTQVSSGV